MTPPRETLHEETLRWLGAMQAVAPHTHEDFGAQLERIAYAAQCVRDVAALREQVEKLQEAHKAERRRALYLEGRVDSLTKDLSAEASRAQHWKAMHPDAALRAENAALVEGMRERDALLTACADENARLASAAEIVEAMERDTVRIIGWSEDRTRFGLFVDTPDGGEEEIVGPSVLAAYERATQGGATL